MRTESDGVSVYEAALFPLDRQSGPRRIALFTREEDAALAATWARSRLESGERDTVKPITNRERVYRSFKEWRDETRGSDTGR